MYCGISSPMNCFFRMCYPNFVSIIKFSLLEISTNPIHLNNLSDKNNGVLCNGLVGIFEIVQSYWVSAKNITCTQWFAVTNYSQ